MSKDWSRRDKMRFWNSQGLPIEQVGDKIYITYTEIDLEKRVFRRVATYSADEFFEPTHIEGTIAEKQTIFTSAFADAYEECDTISREPPRIAEFLTAFMAHPAHVDAAVGDLNERFHRDLATYGYRRAKRFYWARTLRSILPLLRRAIGRLIKWGLIVDVVKRFFG